MDLSTPGSTSSHELVTSLRDRLEQVLHRHIPDPVDVALVGFPNHPNVGDSAIWLGERAWLGRAGHRLAYSADLITYSRRALSRVLGFDGVIALHGGGNLGDVWPQHEALRERVMQDFPRHRIVQLPQTAYFRSVRAVERARRVYESCSDLVVIARDEDSHRRLGEWFDIRTDLAPDAAFALGSQPTTGQPAADIVWLVRTDEEATKPLRPVPAGSARALDWLDDNVGTALGIPVGRVRAFVQTFGRQSRRIPPAAAAFQQLLIPAFDLLARCRVAYGCEVLAQGRVVVTDRLHAHILCLLLDVPNVVDTGYGKIRSFYETWTSGCAAARYTSDPADVSNRVDELSDRRALGSRPTLTASDRIA
ncbi:MAG: polysaccharide pyruvyl transferase family protein [Actinomycetota bacterium]|nr:polysaccharide pyruvyl transferase family protein [Actinomycetota bacterium]